MTFEVFKRMRFHTKVLVPVVLVMVLLVAIAMYVVNYRITAQLEAQGARSLQTADTVLRNFERIRTRNLRLNFGNLANEPQYRAACQTKDPKTLRQLLPELLGSEMGAELIQYRPADTDLVIAVRRDATIDTNEFARASVASVDEALQGFANTDLIHVGDRLFDIVSVPVRMPRGDEVIGALTFCVRLGDSEAQELSDLTGSGIVLLAGDRVAGASLKRNEVFQRCVSLFDDVRSGAPRGAQIGGVHQLKIPQEHFLVWVGTFETKNRDANVGYVLLYSFEKALAEVHATQRIIVGVSIVAIVLGTIAVWFLVRNVTRPLRELRDSAEAVGRGDFSHRIQVKSHDECGELAQVFNRMTDNLQTSRRQLEETVSTLKNTQAQLIQREKLSAIGEFVAGVTHELNNPLTSVLGFSELLQQTNVDERQRRFIERIASSARRCQKIVQSLLSFARQRAPERKPTNVNELLEAVMEIMAYEMRTSNIEAITALEPNLPFVMGDGHQLQQVFLNLVNNARQAMEEHRKGGRLRIVSQNLAGKIRVTFSDNGPGISAENLKKIFDPFFTTKEAGKGTGLGLSLSYGIIQEHGGTISADSRPGQGATFVVELPAHSAHVALVPEQREQPTASAGQGRRVLVVDDEHAILEFISEVLAADGYQVETAAAGETAVRLIRSQDYHVVLCDWKMPGISGEEVFRRIADESPDTANRFVFMTGDVINARMEAFLSERKRPCLAKPFSISEFKGAVARLCTSPSEIISAAA